MPPTHVWPGQWSCVSEACVVVLLLLSSSASLPLPLPPLPSLFIGPRLARLLRSNYVSYCPPTRARPSERLNVRAERVSRNGARMRRRKQNDSLRLIVGPPLLLAAGRHRPCCCLLPPSVRLRHHSSRSTHSDWQNLSRKWRPPAPNDVGIFISKRDDCNANTSIDPLPASCYFRGRK
jgi:hypothetical protein